MGFFTIGGNMPGRGKKMTTEDFILKAEAKHGKGVFDYSKVKYVDRYTEVDIKCLKCGTWVKERPKNHMDKHRSCTFCRKKEQQNPEKLIAAFEDIHSKGRYDYSKVVPKPTREKVEIGCNECGNWFQQVIAEHKRGNGCPLCSKQRSMKNLKNQN